MRRFIQFIFSRKVILIWLALVTFGLTGLLAKFPAMTNSIYSNGVYQLVAPALSSLSRLFPFSLDDVFYILLVLALPVLFVLLIIRRIKFRTFILIFLNTLAAGYLLFYWLWGFNYFRPALNERLRIAHHQTDTSSFRTVLDTLINRVNAEYVSFDTFLPDQINLAVEQSYKQSAGFLGLNYPTGSRTPKQITFSDFFAQAGISGYYGPFFNEIHLNSHLLPVEYPMVLGHEKAHQFGITREAEANFYGWFVCASSDNQQLRYSGNLYLLQYFLWYARKLEDFTKIVARLRPEVTADMEKIQRHWQTLRNEKVNEISSQVNDAYLKTNKVEKGVDDYRGVVGFVMDVMTDPMVRQKTDIERIFRSNQK